MEIIEHATVDDEVRFFMRGYDHSMVEVYPGAETIVEEGPGVFTEYHGDEHMEDGDKKLIVITID